MSYVKVLDLPGLAENQPVNVLIEYAQVLGLTPDEVIVTPQQRAEYLRRLRHGAGYEIITGPSGAPYWGLVSIEVKVSVVPDGYEYTERFDDEKRWGLTAAGFDRSAVTALLNRRTELSTTDPRYARWRISEAFRWDLEGGGDALIIEQFPVEVWDIEQMFNRMAEGRLHALDWEWNTEDWSPEGLAYADEEVTAYLPFVAKDVEYDERVAQEAKVRFSNHLLSGAEVIFHEARADIGAMFIPDPIILLDTNHQIHDTKVQAYLTGEPDLHLKVLGPKEFPDRLPLNYPGSMQKLPVATAARYAGMDARMTYDLFHVYKKRLEQQGQWEVYEKIERPLTPMVASMERYGVPLDLEAVKEEYKTAVTLEQRVRQAVRDNYGYDLANDEQTKDWLQSVLGYRPGSLDQRELTMYPQGEVDLILLFRRNRTLRRNFLGRALKYYYSWQRGTNRLFKGKVRETRKVPNEREKFEDWKARMGRVEQGMFRYFPQFNQAGPVDQEHRTAPRSGRFSSSNPNIQQPPRKTRRIFVPPPGYLWWSFDYSGLELTISADESSDKRMLGVLNELDTGVCYDCGQEAAKFCSNCERKLGDLHGAFRGVLHKITGRWLDRSEIVKPGNFEQLYGGGVGKFIEIVAKSRTHIDWETGAAVVEGHPVAFPDFHVWKGEKVAAAYRDGGARTAYGRWRGLPELRLSDDSLVGYAERVAVNHVIQGTAADVVKIAMQRVAPVLRKYGAHLALQVHDELDGWVPENVDIEAFKRDVVESLQSVELKRTKLRVEGDVGRNWGEAH